MGDAGRRPAILLIHSLSSSTLLYICVEKLCGELSPTVPVRLFITSFRSSLQILLLSIQRGEMPFRCIASLFLGECIGKHSFGMARIDTWRKSGTGDEKLASCFATVRCDGEC